MTTPLDRLRDEASKVRSARTIRVPVKEPDPNQLDLLASPDGETDASIQARFEQFHRDNPHVYAEIVKLARRAKSSGARKVGIGMIFEVMRWRHTLRTGGEDGYKLNNILRSRYARLVMAQETDLRGFFETRELKSK